MHHTTYFKTQLHASVKSSKKKCTSRKNRLKNYVWRNTQKTESSPYLVSFLVSQKTLSYFYENFVRNPFTCYSENAQNNPPQIKHVNTFFSSRECRGGLNRGVLISHSRLPSETRFIGVHTAEGRLMTTAEHQLCSRIRGLGTHKAVIHWKLHSHRNPILYHGC